MSLREAACMPLHELQNTELKEGSGSDELRGDPSLLTCCGDCKCFMLQWRMVSHSCEWWNEIRGPTVFYNILAYEEGEEETLIKASRKLHAKAT